MKNCLGDEAALPYYIWANDDCDAKSEDWEEAKAICLSLIAAGGKSAHIVDADGVEVPDDEIDAANQPPESPPGGYFIMMDYETSADHRKTLTEARQRGQELCDSEPVPCSWSIHDAAGVLVEDITRTDGRTLGQVMQAFNAQHLKQPR